MKKFHDLAGRKTSFAARPCNQAAGACENGANYERHFEGNEENRYTWSNNSVRSILRNPVYVGHLAGYKRQSISMKSKKRPLVPMEDWQVIENTHEGIISQEDFDLVQRLMTSRRKSKAGTSGYDNIFSGIIKCADCGYAMRTQVAHRTKKEDPIDNIDYSCNNYASFGKSACSHHKISARDLHNVVLADIQKHSQMALENDEKLVQNVLSNINIQGKNKIKLLNKDLKQSQKRIVEVDKMFSKLYEDYANERINERNYMLMSKKYETEQAELDSKISSIKTELAQENVTCQNINLWTSQIKEYANIQQLTASLLNSLIDKITISEPTLVDGERVQTVNIFYRFVGLIN